MKFGPYQDDHTMPNLKLITDHLPENLANCFVAGGAINSIYTNRPINDIDLYPKSMEAYEKIVFDLFEDEYWCVDRSNRAVTFASKDAPSVQVMHFDEFETAEKIFEVFDFTICMGAYDLDEKKLILHDSFLEHCSQRFLSFNPKTRFPYASSWRVNKYKEYGYTIGKAENFKILAACAAKPINSWEDLKQQLGGIYGESIVIPDDVEFSTENMFSVLNETIRVKKLENADSYAQVIFATTKRQLMWTEHKEQIYVKINDEDGFVVMSQKPINGIKVDPINIYNGLKFYKKVNSKNGELSSYRPTFKYVVGEYVESDFPHIFVKKSISEAKYHTQGDTIIELQADTMDDVVEDYNGLCLKRAKVVRIVT